MTELLELAIERVRALPPKEQDDVARVLLQMTGEEQPVYQLTPDENADLANADAEIERGELATDEEVHAFWARHGR